VRGGGGRQGLHVALGGGAGGGGLGVLPREGRGLVLADLERGLGLRQAPAQGRGVRRLAGGARGLREREVELR